VNERLPQVTSAIAMAMLLSACAHGSFVAGEKLPGTDGAYYALPTAQVQFKLSVDESCKLTVAPMKQGKDPLSIEYLPDPQAQYRLRIDHSIFAKDTLIVETEPFTGLLKSVNGTGDDQLPTALTSAVQLLGALYGAAPPATAPARPKRQNGETPTPPLPPCKDNTFSNVAVSIDPTDATYSKPFEPIPKVEVTSRPLDNSEVAMGSPTDCTKVVCFRVARPYIVTIKRPAQPACSAQPASEGSPAQPASEGSPAQEFRYLVLAPDPKSVLGVRLDRQAFSDSNVTLTFNNGMLTDYQTTKKSELVSLLQVPLNVGSAIIDTVASLTNLKINHVNEDKNMLTEQLALINAQKELLRAQQDLIKLKLEADQAGRR
jgi:hypothetical protein